jgi:hypothetical protein
MIIPLALSKTLTAGVSSTLEYTPDSGVPLSVIQFTADAAFTDFASVELIWKYEGESPVLIWSISGSSKMPFNHTIPIGEINGTNKLALLLRNLTAGTVSLSGFVILEVPG